MNEMISILTSFVATPAVPISQLLEQTTPNWAQYILWMPLISLVLCGLCAAFKVKTKAPAIITVICLATSFVLTLILFLGYERTLDLGVLDQ